MSNYPEHDKLAAVKDHSQAIGEFLDTVPYTLCQVGQDGHYIATYRSISDLLANYFGIDQATLEREKRAMLDEIRAANR